MKMVSHLYVLVNVSLALNYPKISFHTPRLYIYSSFLHVSMYVSSFKNGRKIFSHNPQCHRYIFQRELQDLMVRQELVRIQVFSNSALTFQIKFHQVYYQNYQLLSIFRSIFQVRILLHLAVEPIIIPISLLVCYQNEILISLHSQVTLHQQSFDLQIQEGCSFLIMVLQSF